MSLNPFPEFVNDPTVRPIRTGVTGLRASSALAAALAMAQHDTVGDDVSGRTYAIGPAPKRAPTYSATPPAPLDKARRRAKQKAAAKARTAQRMRAKGKR